MGEPTDQLYAVLAEADDRLERLREISRRVEAGSGEPTAAPPAEPPVEPAEEPARSRRVTAGSVLLVLGALLLVVAATVFVAVAWGSLSLAARTVLLLGVTGVVAAVALVCLRRTLRASARRSGRSPPRCCWSTSRPPTPPTWPGWATSTGPGS